jgi:hypothetical protein
VGTYANTNGQNANIYFVRVTESGRIMQESVKYFDGIQLVLPDGEKDESQSQDTGNAITGTQDGSFVIAGTITTTPSKGNGAHDLLLIKLDALGGFQWSQLIGGSGDEIPSSIVETPEGNLLVCGTSTVNGLSSIFIVKTDENGELKD